MGLFSYVYIFVVSLRDVFDVEVAPMGLEWSDDHAAVALVGWSSLREVTG